ncbi:SDR family oxidoreductase [Tropicimonas sp. S265A]|uniref:SDR family oxidoreductase n=1 Tax=Tropicimonas sp. S265A TaxID=3415134 RepID=UPI003C7AE36E
MGPDSPVSGQSVLITGASTGIGAEAVRIFTAAGARVAATARSADKLATLAAETGALALPCDVSDFDAMQSAFLQATSAHGPIDILINNAAVIEPIAMLSEVDAQAWSQLIDINVKGVFYGMRLALPDMLARGSGTILTLSSGAAHNALEGWSGYCTSKAAAAMLTRSAHREGSGSGLRVMGLSPGTVATHMQREIKASGINPVSQLDWSDHIPADFPARALLWMCSADADEFCGEEISLRDPDIRARIGDAT